MHPDHYTCVCMCVCFRREFAELMDKYGSNSMTSSGRISPTQLSTGTTPAASYVHQLVVHLNAPPATSLNVSSHLSEILHQLFPNSLHVPTEHVHLTCHPVHFLSLRFLKKHVMPVLPTRPGVFRFLSFREADRHSVLLILLQIREPSAPQS